MWLLPWTRDVRCRMWYKFTLHLLIMKAELGHFKFAAMASMTVFFATSLLPPDHVEYNVKTCYNSLNGSTSS
eukprot:284170-Heterocapsa_arctica.AAC.1